MRKGFSKLNIRILLLFYLPVAVLATVETVTHLLADES